MLFVNLSILTFMSYCFYYIIKRVLEEIQDSKKKISIVILTTVFLLLTLFTVGFRAAAPIFHINLLSIALTMFLWVDLVKEVHDNFDVETGVKLKIASTSIFVSGIVLYFLWWS